MTRRGLFAGIAASAAAATIPAVALAQPAPPSVDAALLALSAELDRLTDLLDDWNDGRIGEEEGDAANDLWWETIREIVDISATTDAGLRAKARALTIGIEYADGADTVRELALSLAADLTGVSA